eukprot:319478-Pelagomonas_calceolata.AAC.1
MGIWRVFGSTRLQNLAVRSTTVFHSTSSGIRGTDSRRLEGKLMPSVMQDQRHTLITNLGPNITLVEKCFSRVANIHATKDKGCWDFGFAVHCCSAFIRGDASHFRRIV